MPRGDRQATHGPGPAGASGWMPTRALARRTHPQRRGRIEVRAVAKAREPARVAGRGRIAVGAGGSATAAAGGLSFAVERDFVKPGKRTTLRLQPRRPSEHRRLFGPLRRGATVRATVRAKITDVAGNTATKRRTVRLEVRR